MQRRTFHRASLITLGLTLPGAASWAQSATGFKPGSDYLVLDKTAPVEAPTGRIEVVEFFWYSCPHCNAFEPALAAWVRTLPKEVAFRRVPVAFREDFVPQQRLFYTLDALGVVDKLHTRVFEAIHQEGRKLARADDILDWAVAQGLDAARFKSTYESFSVATRASRATQLQDAYKVEGVPAMGVAGRYYTDASLAQSMERALQVTAALIVAARKRS